VASFLLNEKRPEIQKLEARLKVNIILVPNPHLDTPHYKIQRLRHDELNAMEHVPASYEMVEQPEEPKLEDATGEAKKERPEAAVKGIVPDQPAPVVPEHQPQLPAAARAEAPRAAAPVPQPVQQSGFMSKILGWFKTDDGKPEAPAANDAMRAPREPRREHQQQQRERRPDQRHGGGGGDQRRDRDHRRDRPRDEQRGGQQQRDHRRDRPRDEQRGGQQQRDHRQGGGQGGERRPDQQRPQQQQRPPRPDRPERTDRPDRPEQPPQGQQPQMPRSGEPAMAGEGEEQRRGRRNRRDRGRDRRPDRGGEQRPLQGLPAGEHDASAPVPAFIAKTPDANELRAREREMHLAQMREEAARQREEAAAREPAREEPVHVEQPAAVESQPAPVRVDPKVILESAGLQMVETNAAKARQPVVEAEPVQLGRPRRERPAAQPAAPEELVQVETRNK